MNYVFRTCLPATPTLLRLVTDTALFTVRFLSETNVKQNYSAELHVSNLIIVHTYYKRYEDVI